MVLFARQSGKDELSAVLKAYLLARLRHREAGIVEVNPTYKPQTINAMTRLERRLRDEPLTRGPGASDRTSSARWAAHR